MMLSLLPSKRRRSDRRGIVLVLSAVLIVVVCALAAMAIDVGFMMLVKTQLQVAADAGALAAGNSLHLSRSEIKAVGKDFTTKHVAGGRKIRKKEAKVEIGIWDADTDTFTPSGGVGNAVRVTASRQGESLFFARVLGKQAFDTEASAIAMANPKDIAFVLDLSGSMNDDTEPAWATTTVNAAFSGTPASGVGTQVMRDVYTDLGFGSFPGTLEYLGAPLGLAQGDIAYAELTSDVGPLAQPGIGTAYRIYAGDDEQTRRERSYRWIIDHQLKRMLPGAKPAIKQANYGYWEKYIDYVLASSYVVAPQPPSDDDDDDDDDDPGDDDDDDDDTPPPPPPPPPPPTPPIGFAPSSQWLISHADSPVGALALLGAHRAGLLSMAGPMLASQVYGPAASGPGLPRVGGMYGYYSAWLPPSQDGDRIDKFNNPNKSSFPSSDDNLPWQLKNYFGYLTYTQFLMDHGRDLQPDGARYVELSVDSGKCPMHDETVAGRNFKFPPRCQPMHATRRSVIAAMDIVKQRNGSIPSAQHRDQIAIVTFDTTDGSQVRQPLTAEYVKAMKSVTKLQAVGDKGTTTATESGLILARQLLRKQSEGGTARERTTRVVVLLTDGIANAYESPESSINNFLADSAGPEGYGGGYYWLDAALMQSYQLEAEGIDIYPVGIGLGTDYDFMDRMSRLGGTAGDSNGSPRGSGNPAEYEALLTEIFREIVSLPTARLVE